jgi:hypothetical protein
LQLSHHAGGFQAKLNARFECSDGGPVSYFLGFNVFRNRPERKLFVSQEHYIDAVMEHFNMADYTPVKTPLPTGFKSIPATDEEFADVRHEEHCAMVGSIMCRHHHSSRYRSRSRGTRPLCQQME